MFFLRIFLLLLDASSEIQHPRVLQHLVRQRHWPTAGKRAGLANGTCRYGAKNSRLLQKRGGAVLRGFADQIPRKFAAAAVVRARCAALRGISGTSSASQETRHAREIMRAPAWGPRHVGAPGSRCPSRSGQGCTTTPVVRQSDLAVALRQAAG